jgi:6-phosphofructo-2-kinase/fructose-2,6-biphosphatase 4
MESAGSAAFHDDDLEVNVMDFDKFYLPRPELGDEEFKADIHLIGSTAEIAANSPRYRRKSSTLYDGVHDLPDIQAMAPAQLYSTESGRLFHSGRIAIVLVGPPARGKT